jgi:hypothetical protein
MGWEMADEPTTLDSSGPGRAEREQALILASESETEDMRVAGWQRLRAFRERIDRFEEVLLESSGVSCRPPIS